MEVVTVPTGKRGFDPRYQALQSRPSGEGELGMRKGHNMPEGFRGGAGSRTPPRTSIPAPRLEVVILG